MIKNEQICEQIFFGVWGSKTARPQLLLYKADFYLRLKRIMATFSNFTIIPSSTGWYDPVSLMRDETAQPH